MRHRNSLRASLVPGFSLLELLLVVAIIALLASLILPALATAHGQGLRIACQNHLKQLGACVQMYAADSGGRLPDNNPGNTNTWVSGNMLIAKEATNQVLIQQGKLFPYASQVGIYHCPADPSRVAGWPRIRSYSMNGWLGSRFMETYGRSIGFRTFLRDNELAVAGPAGIWLLIDEHEASINDAWFLVTMDDSRPFASFPAQRHQQGYGLGFGDGHVESANLRDPESLRLGQGDGQVRAANIDWIRLKQITTVR
jgi:prepilin-type N-terminal cleavage/methylation domain-containing protein